MTYNATKGQLRDKVVIADTSHRREQKLRARILLERQTPVALTHQSGQLGKRMQLNILMVDEFLRADARERAGAR